MTCPHCGFVFEGTAHCPNCGRAPGKPGRDKAYYKEPQKPAQPSEPEVQQGDTQVFTRKSRPKRPPAVQQPQVYSQQLSPSQQLYTPQTQQFPTKQSSPKHNTAKKKDRTILIGILCMIAIILVGVVAALIIINNENTKNASLDTGKTTTSEATDVDAEESSTSEAAALYDGTKVYNDLKVIGVIPAGTWATEDESLQITIGSDNSVSWIRNGQHYTTNIEKVSGTAYNTVSKWEYPSGAVYVGDEEYPQSQYSRYRLELLASKGIENLDLWIFRDKDTMGQDVNEINIYDRKTVEYHTLKRIK